VKCIEICARNHPPLTSPVEGGETDLPSPLAGEGRERGIFIKVIDPQFSAHGIIDCHCEDAARINLPSGKNRLLFRSSLCNDTCFTS
jgi:hypothetical protein